MDRRAATADPHGTTAVFAYIRRKVTPAGLWSAIVATFGMLVLAVTAWVNTQKNVTHLQEFAAQQLVHEQKVEEQQQAHEQEINKSLQQLVTGQAVANGKMDSIVDKVDQLQEWRNNIEGVANEPRRRRH